MEYCDDGGSSVEGFEAIVGDGVKHFETLFEEDKILYLPKILKIAKNIPTFVSDEVSPDLMAPVSLSEIQAIIALCKNDKSLGQYGIHVEVYRVLFNVLGLDIVRVVDDSRTFHKILVVFNSTLISLIPKSDLP